MVSTRNSEVPPKSSATRAAAGAVTQDLATTITGTSIRNGIDITKIPELEHED